MTIFLSLWQKQLKHFKRLLVPIEKHFTLASEICTSHARGGIVPIYFFCAVEDRF